jgi:hypothetical protein
MVELEEIQEVVKGNLFCRTQLNSSYNELEKHSHGGMMCYSY